MTEAGITTRAEQRRHRALVAVAQSVIDASLDDLLSFLTPERIAAEANAAEVDWVTADKVRYHFRDVTSGVRRFDRARLIGGLVEYLVHAYQPVPEWASEDLGPSQRLRLMIDAPREYRPGVEGLARLRTLVALTARDGAGPYALVPRVLEQRMQSRVGSIFSDVSARDLAWLKALVPTAWDLMRLGQALPIDLDAFVRLKDTTATVVASWISTMRTEIQYSDLPALEWPEGKKSEGPLRPEAIRARSTIESLAFDAIGRASVSDFLAFLTPTTVSARSRGNASRLQVARAFSGQGQATFDPESLRNALLSMRLAQHERLSTVSSLDTESWRSGFYSRDDGWLLVCEILSWICLVAGASDADALESVTGPMVRDLGMAVKKVPVGPKDVRELATDAVVRECLLVWVARLRRWCAPWEGPSPVASLVAAGNLVGMTPECVDAAEERRFARAAFQAVGFRITRG